MQHPDYLTLTWEQFLGWARYAERHPFGEIRADERFEAFRQRLLAALGAKGEVPRWTYPYFERRMTAEERREVIEHRKDIDRRLEPKPGGGYRWKAGMSPYGDDHR